jgi:hypothetical protein
MIGKTLIRLIRRRSSALMIWAMMPLAIINGQSVSGCMSPTGHFEPSCHCEAMQPAAQNASTTCPCHCPCCQGKNCCCCKGKDGCCKSLARNESRPNSDGIQSSGHCTPFSMYVTMTAVRPSAQSSDLLQAAAVLPVAWKIDLSPVPTVAAYVAELNTGPPPNNLVVTLHHWTI